MFVQLVLENIWAVYDATVGGQNEKGDPELLEKITKSLNITIPPHVKRSRDPKALLSAVFSSWLPLSTALLVSVIEHLPSPQVAQEARMPALLQSTPGSDHIESRIAEAMVASNQSINEPLVAYVSKMVSIPESELPANKRRGGMLTAEEARELGRKKRAEIAKAQALANEGGGDVGSIADALSGAAIGEDYAAEEPAEAETDDPEQLVGFARVFSGTLTVGDEVYILPPKYSPARPYEQPVPKKVTITALYLLMGRSLESLGSVPAGNVVGIGGLEGAVLKSGTICSQAVGAPNLSSTSAISASAPIVRVAIEPAWPGDLEKMIRGLKLLEQADPAVTYEQLESGEHVILTAGELHLERCLKDLKERFAKCDVQAGEAMVPYREGIVKAEEMNPPKDPALGRGRVEMLTLSKQAGVKLRVRPLPPKVTDYLVRYSGAIKRLYSERKKHEEKQRSGRGDTEQIIKEHTATEPHGDETSHEDGVVVEDHDMDDEAALGDEAGSNISIADLRKGLAEAFHDDENPDKEPWAEDTIERIVAFGPRRVGPNILIDATQGGLCERFLHELDHNTTAESATHNKSAAATLADKVSHGFQLATYQGPLCNEPMQGVSVILESLDLHTTDSDPSKTPTPPHA